MNQAFADFSSHLEELRRRLIISFLVFVALSIAAYFFAGHLLEWVMKPLQSVQDVELVFQKPYEAFLLHVQAAALAGAIASSPVWLMQLWLFIGPGLYAKEKHTLLILMGASIGLFLIGAWFAYALILPWGLQFLLSYQTPHLKPLLGVAPYASFVASTVLAFAFLFDLPVVLVGLVKLGILQTRTLARMRKGIVVLIMIAAAVLTPSPDPLSQILLAAPLYLLFEISLWIAGRIESGPGQGPVNVDSIRR